MPRCHGCVLLALGLSGGASPGTVGSQPQTAERVETSAEVSGGTVNARMEARLAVSTASSAAPQTSPEPAAGMVAPPAGSAAATPSTLDLTKEHALLEAASAALKATDSKGAREHASAAIDALLARPEAERDGAWLHLLERAGRAAQDAQDPRTASRARRVVLEVRSRTLPDEHPDLQSARFHLANSLYALGDLTGARALQEKVLDVFSRTLPDGHPNLQKARSFLAATLYKLGDLTAAKVLQEQVLEVDSRTLPDEHPDLQKARGNLALTRRKLGDLQGAMALQEKVLEVRTRTLPEGHPELQEARQKLADTLVSLGDHAGARLLEEQVLEVHARTMPDEHPDLQKARSRLAATLHSLGDLRGARELQEKALEVGSRTLPDEHPELQMARGNLAVTLSALGDLQGARALQEQVLQVRSRTLPEEHSELLKAREALAATLVALGDLQGARALQEQVHEVRTRTQPDEHPDLQRARLKLANTLRQLGALERAKELGEHVLELRSRTLPADHPDLQVARGNLGMTLRGLGDLGRARALQEEVLAAYSRTLPDAHPDLQTARSDLAGTLKELGDLQGARALHERVLGVRTRTLPKEHPDLQTARSNLAGTLKELGDLQGARVWFEKVLEVYSRTLPEEHPSLHATRMNLAVTIGDLGDLRGARALLEQVLEFRSRTLPTDHLHLQVARGNLALIVKQLGDLERARALEEQVLEVVSRTLPGDHPYLQRARLNLARTLNAMGDLAVARALEEQVLEVCSRTLPDEHPDLQKARENLAATIVMEHALAYARAGGTGGAMEEGRKRSLDLLTTRCASERRAAQALLLEAAPREAEERCSTIAKALDFPLSLAGGLGAFPVSRELDRPCFVLSETTRGAALGSASVMRTAAGSSEYAKLRRELAASSKALAELAASGTTSEAFRTARERREALERELVALGKGLGGTGLARGEFDTDKLAATLGEHDAIVAYRRFTRFRVAVPDKEGGAPTVPPVETSESSLCAFVLRRGADAAARVPDSGRSLADLSLVELGPIAPIEQAVREWRNALGSAAGRGVMVSASEPGAGLTALGDAVRRLVFDPLRTTLGDVRRIILVLDDVLHLVPFDVLPVGAGRRELLGDGLRIETRATAVELLAAPAKPEGADELLAIGGVAFDEREPSSDLAGILRGASSGGFAPLPATEAEVEALAASFSAHRSAVGLVVLSGAEATRERLLELAPRARWLHVATHGWFASESIRSWADPEPVDVKSGLYQRLSGEEQVKGMSPMLLSGLALAGANLPENAIGRARGLITAQELAALDLTHCELVVLSACDTNVGERRAGQGVASLQMALQMAGARSVVTSLWKVPDEATKELMLDFYRRLWVERQPKGQALMEAKRRLRDAKDEHGNPMYTLRDWAAWVLTGEPD